MSDEEEWDDDEDGNDVFSVFGVGFHEIEVKPINKFAFINFFFTLVMGILRSLMEATSQLSDAVLGHEEYGIQKREFEDAARIEIDSIADGTSDGE